VGFWRWFVAPERSSGDAVPRAARWLNWIVAFLLVTAFFAFAFSQLQYTWNWSGVLGYREAFLRGWVTTLWLSAAALVLSTTLGVIIAAARRSGVLVWRNVARLYVEIIRGTPLLVQIYVFFYVVADAFHIEDRYFMGVVILSIFTSAYISEIVRAGIESVGASQWESARAIGLTRRQTYRYVVFPQAFRQMLPPLAGQFVSLVKDSSLLSIIAIGELTHNASKVSSTTASPFESYLPLAAGYLIITLPLSIWTRRLEERHRFET